MTAMSIAMSRMHRPGAPRLLPAAGMALALFAGAPAAAAEPLPPAQRFEFELWAQKHCPADTVVWVDATRLTYNSSDERWYGRTNGAFACKGEAEKAGYRVRP